MQEIESLVKTSLGEIQKGLRAETVVGDSIIIEGYTLIPLISIGFGFGAGGIEGKGEYKKKENDIDSGAGGGAGGGAGIKPVALIIIDKNGSITVESIRGGIETTVEKIVEKIPDIMEKHRSN